LEKNGIIFCYVQEILCVPGVLSEAGDEKKMNRKDAKDAKAITLSQLFMPVEGNSDYKESLKGGSHV